MGRYVLRFDEIDRSQIAIVGGKAANLGELSRIEGVRVPNGFCVTTDAFERIMAEASSIDERIDRLSELAVDDQAVIHKLSVEIREIIESVTIPHELASQILHHLTEFDGTSAFAIRSSATAEDLPFASFAGQQDSFLNVKGAESILLHISRCWGSLFTERAVTYRLRNGFDHRKIQMAVVVQQMVNPISSGILFTADPVSGNRKTTSVEAICGLGEALVSGQVNADVYTVRDGVVVATSVAAIDPMQSGKTQGAGREEQPALSDTQIERLAELGRRIEAHFGQPQDIEWCLDPDGFQIVQSRPITTLFPIPALPDDENRVFVSVGHQQMMTDPMRPLGLSLFQMTAGPPMHEAGGRLFVDVTRILAAPASRANYMDLLTKADPLTRDALQTILDRGDFIVALPDAEHVKVPSRSDAAPIEPDPAIVHELIANNQASIAALNSAIEQKSGVELLDFIRADIQELKRLLFDPRSHQVIMTGMDATWWLNDHMLEWLGEKNAADTLTQSVPDNITSEMGLALMAVADVIRPYPEVVAYLQHAEDDDFLNGMVNLDGGTEAAEAIRTFLARYGMRCVGEIDITRPRWFERPSLLLPIILGNVRNFASGEAERRFAAGLEQASQKEEELIDRIQALPDGRRKADETKRMIDRVRTFTGYREYPKYGIICRYALYKQALVKEAERLVETGVVGEIEDIYYLKYQELEEAVQSGAFDNDLIQERRNAYKLHQALVPPRVLTSDGESVLGSYHRENIPAGALIGLPVSAGTVEGRARVVLVVANAHLESGDILVTTFTDPSWTPVFVGIRGLVTEVGAQMTHGAVIAREYGLPAVVGVQHATQLIKDGQKIRVHGTEGYVEILN